MSRDRRNGEKKRENTFFSLTISEGINEPCTIYFILYMIYSLTLSTDSVKTMEIELQPQNCEPLYCF